MEYGNQFSIAKSFYDWCLENNRMDLNSRFDEEKNKCTTKDIGYKSNLQYWFKCPRGIHESDKYWLCAVTNNKNAKVSCRKCNSLAQIVIDKFGEEYFWNHWHKDNILDPFCITASSNDGSIKIKIQCLEKDYHVYEQVPASFAKGIGCPYCINRKVHPKDSLAAIYPEIINRWSVKNTNSPYEYSPHSSTKVWLKCPENKHEDYLQTIANAVTYGFTCRKCENEKVGRKKRGENCKFWKGGVAGQNDVLRHQFEYKNWRKNVYERDNYTCQCCGKHGKLNAHHLISFAD